MGGWLDGYTHITDNARSDGGTIAPGYPARVVWHTVEGGISVPSARGHSSPPHLWVDPIRRVKLQTVPLDRSSYAMWDQADYPHRTNKANAVQVEIAGYAAEAGGWPDSTLVWLAAEVLAPVVEFIRSQGGTFDFDGCPDPPKDEQIGGSSYENAPQRFTWAKWATFNSHCGHRHVTGNGDRYDPGLLNLRKISAYTAELVGTAGTASVPTPPIGELTVAQYEDLVARITRMHDELNRRFDAVGEVINPTRKTVDALPELIEHVEFEVDRRADALGEVVNRTAADIAAMKAAAPKP